jgi:two-component system, NarL family, sensor histidine kinase DesK
MRRVLGPWSPDDGERSTLWLATGDADAPAMKQRGIRWFSRTRDNEGPKRWRRGGGFWLVYLLSPLGSAWNHHQLAASIAGTALLVLFAWGYLFLVPRAWYGCGTRRDAYLVWSGLLVVDVAATAVIGVNGLTGLVFVAAAGMVLLPARPAIAIMATLAVASTVVPIYVTPWQLHALQWSIGAGVAMASVAVFAFTRLIRANHELAAAREQVAELAAERERLRIARDLHDLLGHSLTTVTVKAALAKRLVETDPERAKAEIGAVELLARESLTDTRTAVAGYREVRLATELATAREVLAAAGIQAELPGVIDDVPADLASLFGWVVREGITNVVRHSRAGAVKIVVHGRAIEIVDDGRGCAGDSGGSGLAGLAERAAALGGRLVAGPLISDPVPHGFRLRVDVP